VDNELPVDSIAPLSVEPATSQYRVRCLPH